MSDRTPFDDFRDLAEGRLDAASAAHLRARLDSDAALLAEFEAYHAVHAFTAPAAGPVPASSLTFDRLDAARRAGRVRRMRPRIAVAASLLLVAAGAFAWHHHMPRTVVLRAIPLSLSAVAIDDAPSVPARLADWRPVAGGAVNWIPSLEEGRDVARATNRPMFLWIYHPTCPICIGWDRGAFRDAEVAASAAEFVPVRVDVMKAPPGIERFLGEDMSKGWPYLGVMSADETERVDFAGDQGTDEIRGHLTSALATQAKLGAAVPWEVAAGMARADRARTAGDVAAQYRELAAVHDAAPAGAMRSAAAKRLDAIAASAAAALRFAQSLAATDEDAGARSLSEAAERFRGTPYGPDLAEVEQGLRATGRFPVLETAAKQ
jgi:hypothetical protein